MENWDNLRFYLAVARSGTVSAAAKELAVTHATVLRRVEQIEKELGTKLFKRLQSGYVLNESGKALLPSAEEIERETLNLARQFQGADDQLSGKLRVTQPENEVVDLYPLYALFIEQYPNIQLEINSSSELVNLNKQEADVAIRFTKQPSDLLVGHCVGKVTSGAFCSHKYRNRFKHKPTLSECDWILWSPSTTQAGLGIQYSWLKNHVSNPKVIMRTSSVSDKISAIRAGIGVGLLSHSIAKTYDDLLEISSTKLTSSLKLWIVTHRDLRKLVRVNCFMRFMLEGLRAQLERN